MKLSDGTIINEPIKFLGAIYIESRRNEPDTYAFTFNSHKIHAGTDPEGAIALRNEIIENVPQAEIKTPVQKTAMEWETPPINSGDEMSPASKKHGELLAKFGTEV